MIPWLSLVNGNWFHPLIARLAQTISPSQAFAMRKFIDLQLVPYLKL
jgi:hypothetical protein